MQIQPLWLLGGALLGGAGALVLSCGGAQRPSQPAEPSAGAPVQPAAAAPPAEASSGRVPDQSGLATWYGAALAGHKTTSGERFNPNAMTAAHRKLPLGTWVDVRCVDTGRTVRVRINDRGPWGDDRKIIDLSRAAADELGFRRRGVARVELYVVRRAQ